MVFCFWVVCVHGGGGWGWPNRNPGWKCPKFKLSEDLICQNWGSFLLQNVLFLNRLIWQKCLQSYHSEWGLVLKIIVLVISSEFVWAFVWIFTISIFQLQFFTPCYLFLALLLAPLHGISAVKLRLPYNNIGHCMLNVTSFIVDLYEPSAWLLLNWGDLWHGDLIDFKFSCYAEVL